MELMDYLENKYGKNRPFFAKEISTNQYSNEGIRKALSRLAKEKKISRFSQGVYFIPNQTLLGDTQLSPISVAERKYLTDGKDVYGFYSGIIYANEMNISSQIPNIREIVSNKEASIKREVSIDSQKVIVRKPYVKITKENLEILRFLDFINSSDEKKIKGNYDYLKKEIKQKRFGIPQLKEVISKFPAKTSKKILESGLIYEFAQK
jgi:hypothetical protein